MTKILANDGIDAAGKKLLNDAGIEVDTNKVPQEQLITALKNFDGILVRSATKVRKDIIDACPNLKLIGRGGVGMDNIDVEYARSKKIEVINTPAASSLSVAELVFAHLFGMARFLPDSNRQMPANGLKEFNNLKKKYANGIELRGKTLGVMGLGRIGAEVAKIGLGVGMRVIACGHVYKEIEIEIHFQHGESIKIPIKKTTKEQVLAESDFITIHAPFESGQEPLLNKTDLAKMKNGVGIINAARGGAIRENDLLEALNSGKVAYAGIDVFEEEPTKNNELLNHPNVSLSPHIGASTTEAQERIGIELAEKVIAFFKK